MDFEKDADRHDYAEPTYPTLEEIKRSIAVVRRLDPSRYVAAIAAVLADDGAS